MRIISLHPFATDILDYCGIGWNLVGLTHVCSVPKNSAKAKIVTGGPNQKFLVTAPELKDVANGLSTFQIDIEQIIDRIPDVILADVIHPDKESFIPWAEEILKRQLGKSVTIRHLALNTLEEVYSAIQSVGQLINKPRLADKLVVDIQKHISEWRDAYSHLCKGKKVVLLSDTTPLIAETGWVDDLVHLFGALTLGLKSPGHCVEVTWREIVEGRPDVLFVAPHNAYLDQSVRRLPALETSEGWEDLPAVKRGAVFFAPGTDLYRPGPRFLKGVAALVAAIAGMDRPIFHDQNESYQIRHVEMFRHKLLEHRG